jgi:hypothetical protein
MKQIHDSESLQNPSALSHGIQYDMVSQQRRISSVEIATIPAKRLTRIPSASGIERDQSPGR